MIRVGLDNMENCPRGHRCESCGIESADLAVCTADLGNMGVACLTLCVPCADSDIVPPITVGTAARLVGQHCQHLGIDLDQMAAAIGPRPRLGRAR